MVWAGLYPRSVGEEVMFPTLNYEGKCIGGLWAGRTIAIPAHCIEEPYLTVKRSSISGTVTAKYMNLGWDETGNRKVLMYIGPWYDD